jgi:hypothetical protein
MALMHPFVTATRQEPQLDAQTPGWMMLHADRGIACCLTKQHLLAVTCSTHVNSLLMIGIKPQSARPMNMSHPAGSTT